MIQPPATPNGLLARDDELPFQAEMFREHAAGNMHQFILYFNVHDFVFVPRFAGLPEYRPRRLRDYLGRLLHARGFDVVMYYSLADGISLLDEAAMRPRLHADFPEDLKKSGREYGQADERRDSVPPTDESMVALSYLDRLLTYRPDDLAKVEHLPRIAVILEYLESLAPHEDSVNRAPHHTFAVQMLHQWAMDRRLHRHLVVGLASDLGHVASSLYAATSECRAYRLDLPVEELQPPRPGAEPRRERRDWLRWVLQAMSRESPPAPNPMTLPLSAEQVRRKARQIESVEDLALLASGFNRDNLRDLAYYASRAGEALTVEAVHRRKREIITAESRDLLEIVEPRVGFEAVAGYQYVKAYLGVVKQAIERQSSDPALAVIVPKGILFLGPPGTGKSFVASALAAATGFNMVKFKNIRSMWVGESERNLNRVLDLLTGMAPVIVFVDEVDQALGTRQVGGGGDSGVEQRLFQRMLEFMALDENRGRVLWIAASNRPDGIDPALISRFDVVMPFLMPDPEARRQMLFKAYPKKIEYDFPEPPADVLEELVRRTADFSGRELDTVIRRALQLAGEERLRPDAPPAPTCPTLSAAHLLKALDDFRPAHDANEYELQTLLAIQACNFYKFLPTWHEMPPTVRPDSPNQGPLDEARLQVRIDELRLLMGRRRMAEMGLL